MRRIPSWDKVLQEISFAKKNGAVLSNFYPNEEEMTEWIKEERFFSSCVNNSLFLFHNEKSCFRVFYFTDNFADFYADSASLCAIKADKEDAVFVMDIISQKEKFDPHLLTALDKSGFQPYCQLVRMSRFAQEVGNKTLVKETVRYASFDDAHKLQQLLDNNFDKYAERVPPHLMSWIENQSVIVISQGSNLCGFIIFEITGFSMVLRYFFVDSAFRRQGLGSSLLEKLFDISSQTKRQLLWVRHDNLGAITLYEKYGYCIDNLVDTIYLCR